MKSDPISANGFDLHDLPKRTIGPGTEHVSIICCTQIYPITNLKNWSIKNIHPITVDSTCLCKTTCVSIYLRSYYVYAAVQRTIQIETKLGTGITTSQEKVMLSRLMETAEVKL